MSSPCFSALAATAEPVAFDDAVHRLMRVALPVGTEELALRAASGRVLARGAVARRAAPLVAVSAMDGYAVRDADTSSRALRIVGKSFAGAGFQGRMESGECIRIFTGAPLPRGADRVVVQEDATLEGGHVRFSAPMSPRRHVRAAGSDFESGDVLVAAGRRLRPQDLIAAAAGDLGKLEVFRRPRTHIICCGDELVPPGKAGDSPDHIPESISVGVSALIDAWGGTVSAHALLPDDLESLEGAARAALLSADLVVVIGGASVGERDFAKRAFANLGVTFLFRKVAIKPGKPVWLGEVQGKPVVGLPGNPTSALVTARLFLAPLVAGMAGFDPLRALAWRSSCFEGQIEPCEDRDVFLRACVSGNGARSLPSQDSADQKALADADVLVRIPRAGASDRPVEMIDL